MKRDDIIATAREAGIPDAFLAKPHPGVMTQLERFAALVASAERKACCQIVTGLCISDNNAEEINKAILARGKHDT
jgi:hypothetical protein